MTALIRVPSKTHNDYSVKRAPQNAPRDPFNLGSEAGQLGPAWFHRVDVEQESLRT